MFDRCSRRWAMATPVKYERDSKIPDSDTNERNFSNTQPSINTLRRKYGHHLQIIFSNAFS